MFGPLCLTGKPQETLEAKSLARKETFYLLSRQLLLLPQGTPAPPGPKASIPSWLNATQSGQAGQLKVSRAFEAF